MGDSCLACAFVGVVLLDLETCVEANLMVSIEHPGSKDSSVDVNAVASVFGGGGHRAASGYKTTGELSAVKQALLAQFETLLKR